MSISAQEELLIQHVAMRKDDPEVEARRLRILQVLLDHAPEVRQWLIEKGRLEVLVYLFKRRLSRPLTSDEQEQFGERLRSEGGDRLIDVALDLSPEALASWLASKTDR